MNKTLLLLGLLVAAGVAHSQELDAPTEIYPALFAMPASQLAPPEHAGAVGIGLEGVEYPAPVKFLPLENEGQPVRMAFMDVVPKAGRNGRAVVLLHGKNFQGDYWRETMRALLAAGFRVVVPDQVGFGKSSKPDMPYSFDLLAANTAKLLDALKIEKAAVVGHSMGGMLAVRFARNYPERVSALVLENPIGLEDYRFSIPPKSTEFWFEKELANTDAAKIRAFYRNYFTTDKVDVTPLAAARIGVTLSGEYPRWARASALTYQMIYQQPVRHEFALLRVPTLLVIGQADRTAVGKDLVSPTVAKTLGNYPELGRAAARDIPGAKLVELPNVGHIPHLEATAAFHAALLQFLK